ncbi:hypothetical protein DPMN_170077 [Dreissena polymorpha]|uniref:Uncharacterized protein n=1 Tax=Dreissena polymorpha TaxID=45954 RepID=A0A9D4IB81_DREPO|nr:hypothetical protein DPMN_170077 [Dreissena polymorpha]
MAVANTDGDNPSKEVEVSSIGVVEQPLHVTLMDQQRFAVVCEQRGRQVCFPDVPNFLVTWTLKKGVNCCLYR